MAGPEVVYCYLMVRFGEWLNEELQQRKWIQADLARETGLPDATISRILSGERGVGKKSIACIARALD